MRARSFTGSEEENSAVTSGNLPTPSRVRAQVERNIRSSLELARREAARKKKLLAGNDRNTWEDQLARDQMQKADRSVKARSFSGGGGGAKKVGKSYGSLRDYKHLNLVNFGVGFIQRKSKEGGCFGVMPVLWPGEVLYARVLFFCEVNNKKNAKEYLCLGLLR